ncbi:hypothetical protein MIND_01366300 [Mycena indigotica]|uniref:DUF6534 domain-containing protein n=1 Tax=Mycena indigotica TaxID=2126181 RepID=A0A8H6VVM1_9AGAR|nr:uncharacterized protein MIND_01366300 [Mycena indigotica]KAF7289914.1 hypothetical protein MIND_01366300 [Mycena indigotica]
MASSAPPPGLPALPPIPPNIGQIAGPQLIGSLLNFYLFGVLSVQIYVYRISFDKDKLSIKLMVYTVFLLMLVSTCLNAADAYYWYADGFGNLIQFSRAHISPFYTPILGSIIALSIQLFFCYRIWIIKSAALPLSICIAIVSVLQAVGGIGAGLKAYIAANSLHDEVRTILVYMWLIGDAVADVAIAIAMSVLLTKASKQAHSSSNYLVKRIVRLILETNALSAGVAVLGLVLFAGIPGTTYFIPPTMILPGIYANTLLVTFNNRAFPGAAPRTNLTQGTPSFTDSNSNNAYPRAPIAPMTFAANPNRVLVTTHKVSDADGISLSRLERGPMDDNKVSGWNDAP